MLRRTDTNYDGDFTDEDDRVDNYLTDAQFSVVAVVGPTGALRERVVYSPYGEARHHWPADLDGDGDVDSGDMAWYQNSANLVGIGHANYNPDADLNRDGVVGTQDIVLALNWNGKAALAAGLISDPNGPDSPVGYCGYLFNAETGLYTVRFRHYDPVWGRWVERDPAGYVDGTSLYEYAWSSPLNKIDPGGLYAEDEPTQDEKECGPDCKGSLSVLTYTDTAQDDRAGMPRRTRQLGRVDELIADIKNELQQQGKCCVRRVQIDAHSGVPGYVTIGTDFTLDPSFLDRLQDPETVAALRDADLRRQEQLRELGSLLCDGGVLELVQCDAGFGPDGQRVNDYLDDILGPNRYAQTYPGQFVGLSVSGWVLAVRTMTRSLRRRSQS